MAVGAGLAGQFGYKTETEVGTYVTVDMFLPFDSEAVDRNIERLESAGIRAGRHTTAVWKAGQDLISGPIVMDLWETDIATLLHHCFGAVATTGSGPYTHTLTPGNHKGLSFTVQVGRPDIAGTVNPFTWAGCKISSWTISASVGSIAKLELIVAAMTETTAAPGLAVASYAASDPFVFTEGSVSIAGVAVATVKSVDLTGDNALPDRVRIGSATSKERLQDDLKVYSGTIVADFEALTAYNRIAAGTEAALVLAFNNGTETLTFTLNARFDGSSPTVDGPGMLEQTLEYKAVHATADASAITGVLVNSEASAA